MNNSLAAIFFSNLINGEFFCTIIRGIWVEQLPIINKWCHLLLETLEYLSLIFALAGFLGKRETSQVFKSLDGMTVSSLNHVFNFQNIHAIPKPYRC